MKKSLFIFIAAIILLACVSGACAKAPAGEATVPTQLPEATEAPLTTPYGTVSETEPAGTVAPSDDMLLVCPPGYLSWDFSSYAELAAAFLDKDSIGYDILHTWHHSGGMEALGPAYNTFINGLESGELTLPLPLIDGEPALLGKPEYSIAVFSYEKFNLPCVMYFIECGEDRVMIVLTPLSVADDLELNGSETYSDVAKILAPGYPTEDTPKEHYTAVGYLSVSACELELAGGRKVWATVLERRLDESSRRIDYNFVYDGYVVSVWEWISPADYSNSHHLPDWFFSHFSLGGSITDI